MKKILISLVIALVLCVGSIGTAVAVTAHHHNCVQNECTTHEHANGEVHATKRWQCMYCGRQLSSNSMPSSFATGKCRVTGNGHVWF